MMARLVNVAGCPIGSNSWLYEYGHLANVEEDDGSC
jgi:hypothetical protein